MSNWTIYKPSSNKFFSSTRMAKLILLEMKSLLEEFVGCTGPGMRKLQTRLIKDKLSELGARKLKGKPSYKVYANGISEHLRQENGGPFRNAEWLYDMHWYVNGIDAYTTLEVPMVMECEWNPVHRKDRNKVPFSGIKYDFQKLLLANATLRVMIFKVRKVDHLDELYSYFQNNINNYKLLPKNADFLFIAFPMNQGTFHYCEIRK
jgi:hypothetical protein